MYMCLIEWVINIRLRFKLNKENKSTLPFASNISVFDLWNMIYFQALWTVLHQIKVHAYLLKHTHISVCEHSKYLCTFFTVCIIHAKPIIH